MKRILAVLVPLLLAALALAACGGNSSNSPSAPAPSHSQSGGSAMSGMTPMGPTMSSAQAAAAEIVIKGLAYVVPFSVAPGETITIRNNDDVEHTVTADGAGAFDVEVPASGTATFTAPAQPGSYPSTAPTTPGMHGSLTVR